jgi:hypothetical protein
MLATKPDAREIQLSTPFGTRGFFWQTWKDIKNGTAGKKWEYHEVPAEQCPRIKPEFLVEMQRRMGWWWFEQEFHCKFMDAQSSMFRDADIERMKDAEVELWQLR